MDGHPSFHMHFKSGDQCRVRAISGDESACCAGISAGYRNNNVIRARTEKFGLMTVSNLGNNVYINSEKHAVEMSVNGIQNVRDQLWHCDKDGLVWTFSFCQVNGETNSCTGALVCINPTTRNVRQICLLTDEKPWGYGVKSRVALVQGSGGELCLIHSENVVVTHVEMSARLRMLSTKHADHTTYASRYAVFDDALVIYGDSRGGTSVVVDDVIVKGFSAHGVECTCYSEDYPGMWSTDCNLSAEYVIHLFDRVVAVVRYGYNITIKVELHDWKDMYNPTIYTLWQTKGINAPRLRGFDFL